MSEPRTTTTIEVTPLDLSAKEAEALAFCHDNANPNATGVRFESYGIVDTPAGVFALCTEGVGPEHPITDEDPLVVEIGWREEKDGGVTSFSMMAFATTSFGPDDLREMATGEPVNLAEFIRSFGWRLECNYRAWLNVLTKAEGVAV